MPGIGELEGTPRKDLHVFFVLDISGSMEGERISALNHGMEETITALKDVAASNGDARLKVAAMVYNSNVKWVTINGPEDMEDFEWEYQKAAGLTQVGDALNELNAKLSRHAFLDSMTGALLPIIIFMTDGYATQEYQDALEKIKLNKWFKRATKIGFAIGNDADKNMVADIVGTPEAVISTDDMESFRSMLRFVAVTSSMLNSVSQAKGVITDGTTVVNNVTGNTTSTTTSTTATGGTSQTGGSSSSDDDIDEKWPDSDDGDDW